MRWVMLISLLASCAAWAQERQVVPLRYELWWDERRFWSIGLEQKQTPPKDVKLPQLTKPVFFVWRFADDKCLFALVKEDGEFVLYADTNCNNDLTDERPFRLRQRGGRCVFGPIPMRYRINGKPVIRHIGAEVRTLGDGRVFLYLLVASRWHGTLMWDGKPVSVVVIDSDCNGIINWEDTLILDEGGEERYLSTEGQVGINGRFFRYQVAPTGEELVIEPVQVRTAIVKFQGERLTLNVANESGRWRLEGQNGELIAPVGDFFLVGIEISRKDEQGRIWRLRARAFGPAAPKFAIPETGATLNFEPLQVSIVYDRKGDEFEFSLDIKTANGMSLSGLTVDRRLPPEPRLRLTALGGKVVAEPQFHYG
jgi:hypothetical protein